MCSNCTFAVCWKFYGNDLFSQSVIFLMFISQNTTNTESSFYELFPIPKTVDTSNPDRKLMS